MPATGVAGVAANVTVTEPTQPGYLTIYPSGVSRPLASNLNFLSGQTVPNMVVVQVGADRNIIVFNGSGGTVQFIVDVTGWYKIWTAETTATTAEDLLLNSLVPARIRDTRDGIGGPASALGPGQASIVGVNGVGGVPAGAAAIAANVTVTEPTRPGYLTVYPSGVTRPLASNLNFVTGQTVPNLVVVKVGADGNIAIFNGSSGTVQFIVDVTGWYGPGDPSKGGLLRSVVPVRVRDTRDAIGGAAGALGPGMGSVVAVRGVAGLPASGIAAVAANVTATEPMRPGYLTVYPSGVTRPLASNLNFVGRQTVPNLVIVQVGSDGNIVVFNGSGGTVQFILDVTGYFLDSAGTANPGNLPRAASLTAAAAPANTAFTSTPVKVVRPWQSELRGIKVGQGVTVDGSAPNNRPQVDAERSFPISSSGYAQTRPDRAIGRLYNMIQDRSGKWTVGGTCSATVVARNLVVTAAHCLFQDNGSKWPTWAFAPQKWGAENPYGFFWATASTAPDAYQAGANRGADFALISFDTPNAAGQLLGDVVGWFGIAPDPPPGLRYSVGYPSEGWYNANCDYSMVSCWPVFCSSVADSTDQYVKTQDDATLSYGGWWVQGFGCQMTGGASGGPVFQKYTNGWYVVGVNSYLHSLHPYSDSTCTRPGGSCWWYAENMWSPYFNQVIIDIWNALHKA